MFACEILTKSDVYCNVHCIGSDYTSATVTGGVVALQGVKKCCDVAERAATQRAECHFERQYLGRWMLFDDEADSESKFDVSSGEIRSSTLGSFVCKGKHWELPYYKVLSVFDNSW